MPSAEDKTYTILFLSQRNCARSVIAEALMNAMGRGRFQAFSAGVRPASEFDPVALDLLRHAGVPAPDGAPQHVRQLNALPADFVFTLSDSAAGEARPAWPGHPVTGNWRSADPMQFADDPTGRRLALIRTRKELERRLRLLINLPPRSLDRLSMQTHSEETELPDDAQRPGQRNDVD